MTIRFSIKNQVGSIVIDHGPGNQIDWTFVEELEYAAEEAVRSSARVVVISATGSDFSAGGAASLFAGKDLNQLRSTLQSIQYAFSLIESIPVPTIAAVQGRAWGGGFELALRADFILAERDAVLRFPEGTVGFLPLAGGAQRLAARVGVAVATRLILMTDEVPAEELGKAGVLTVTPRGALAEYTEALTARLAGGPTQAFAGTKAVLAAWSRFGMAAADEVMMHRAEGLFETEDVALAASGSSAFVGR